MFLASLAIIIGLSLLVWSADHFVDGAAVLAKHFKLPPLLIGILILGFGTSAPEMVVSAMAAIDGIPGLALGNAIGSNITNISLVLGITAVLCPITIHSKIIKNELPLLIFIMLFSGYLFFDDVLSTFDAYLLLTGFALIIIWSVIAAMGHRCDASDLDFSDDLQSSPILIRREIVWLIVGLVVLIGSSRLLLWGAVEIVSALGVSDLVIGLTIVAVGTSLPELTTTIAAVRKGNHDIAIGNLIGSNMFNILGVVGLTGAIAPISLIPSEVMSRDWPVMLALTLILLVMVCGFGKGSRIFRKEGIFLLAIYCSYNGYLVYDALLTK
ncbi:calcium/sodium antiporter [uncultured Paraglaciecola sp.]|uniref:calcium/sodium antiporter n=1 Tax=uncultured Paraglaciecola sp. TaxID=1765024 RepID=UPI0030D6EDC5|tara:strand:- start:4501 stop:5478 length:978 start_codon:yes stop_codon:yes gene_type:complete